MNLFAKGHEHNPYTEEELKEKALIEAQATEREAQRSAKVAEKDMLTFSGGWAADYRVNGQWEQISISSLEEWAKLMEEAKAAARSAGRKLTIRNLQEFEHY